MSAMMLVAVKDDKAGRFLPAFCVNSLTDAMRAFQQACLNRETMMWKYPADFSFWQVGFFDTETGSVDSVSQFLANATDYVRHESEAARG